MKKASPISQRELENLLKLFSDDREKAGEEYEKIRRGLIRFFRYRGCEDAELLADETLDRVARKLSVVKFDANIKAASYFYSFALNIFREYLSQRKKESFVELNKNFEDEKMLSPEAKDEHEFECLERCLALLPKEESILLLQYYSRDKKEKTKLRAKLAQQLNLNSGAFYVRIHRIKNSIRNCMEKCLAEKHL